ncbi:MAG: AAA family ATPase [Akkermansiaceae bacterium]|nr:AAA family ATPase [Armatimonadota bacterium]
MTTSLEHASSAVRTAIAVAGSGLVERSSLVETIALCAVAGEHLLVIGAPGTAKSEAVRRVARVLGGQYFEYLLGRFTEPSEIFGPVDLRKLRDGVVETETAGMLPEADIAFLDEVFLGSTAILNTMLGILNERVFRRGHTRVACPLRICVGASNALPQEESLAAFADRFLVRVFVDPIPDPRLEELLESGWSLGNMPLEETASVADLDTLSEASRAADLAAVRPLLAQAIRLLRHNGILLSDRRIVKTQRLLSAAAVLGGRANPTAADLWPLILAVPTREEQAMARDCLRDLLSATENSTLAATAEEASLGPLVRAHRLVVAGRQLLAEAPPQDTEAYPNWCYRLEGVLREIDAGFAPEQLPADLTEVRKTIIARLGQTESLG